MGDIGQRMVWVIHSQELTDASPMKEYPRSGADKLFFVLLSIVTLNNLCTSINKVALCFLVSTGRKFTRKALGGMVASVSLDLGRGSSGQSLRWGWIV